MSKLFTSIALVQQVEAGRIDLDSTVASYLPAFAANGKAGRHRAPAAHPHVGLPGLAAAVEQRADAGGADPGGVRRRAGQPAGHHVPVLRPEHDHAGELVEPVTGKPLDQVVARPDHRAARDARHRLQPAGRRADRIAATEYQTAPPRGMVRGSVHDENAWALNGVAGHAGVFSTADDLAVLAQTLINGGSYGDTRILSEDRWMPCSTTRT